MAGAGAAETTAHRDLHRRPGAGEVVDAQRHVQYRLKIQPRPVNVIRLSGGLLSTVHVDVCVQQTSVIQSRAAEVVCLE